MALPTGLDITLGEPLSFATEAALLATAPGAGKIAWAKDTDRYYTRTNGVWRQVNNGLTTVRDLVDNTLLTASDSGRVITNEGALAAIDVQLMNAKTGYTLTCVVKAASLMKLTPYPGEQIIIGTDSASPPSYLGSSTLGSAVVITAISENTWQVVGGYDLGNWAVAV